jgi:N-acetylmuramoyl-L-alanine amidase
LKLSFTRDPVISFSDAQDLNDKLITSSIFSESNGAATLTVNGTAPLLAKFADDGKTILIGAAPAPPAPTTVVQTATPASSPPASAVVQTATTAPLPASAATRSSISPPAFLVVVDAAHGGSDTGARISPTLAEKDITLSLARKVRELLQARHIATDMLRDGDTDLSLDQRAVLTNLAHAAIFISLHAEPGSTLRIYTPTLPSATEMTSDRAGFLPWGSAQGAFSAQSSGFADLVAQSMEKRELVAQVRPAFVQPLHSIAAPAIAIEAPADSKGLKISEDLIAGAVAEAVAVRKLGAGAPQ